jgi:HEAT repeat protein
LGKIGAPAVAPLVEKLKTAEHPARYHIIQALRNIGTAALDPVLPLARDRNPDLREHACC